MYISGFVFVVFFFEGVLKWEHTHKIYFVGN